MRSTSSFTSLSWRFLAIATLLSLFEVFLLWTWKGCEDRYGRIIVEISGVLGRETTVGIDTVSVPQNSLFPRLNIPSPSSYTLSYLLLPLPNPTTFLKLPNAKTSAILSRPLNNITNRSTPHPQPPVGGIPHSSACK